MRLSRAALFLVALGASACSSSDATVRASSGPAAATSEKPTAPTKVEPPALKAGDAAPPFELMGSDGKKHALADHAGKQAVVVAWFPKAFTGG
ncbi:MAG: hypothetical protein U0414_32835 [Polyangiaceae bacterium]